jgi:hypothetical protein
MKLNATFIMYHDYVLILVRMKGLEYNVEICTIVVVLTRGGGGGGVDGRP